MSFRILVTGSREWTDYERVKREIWKAGTLRNLRKDIPELWKVTVVHGAARGTDKLAHRAALELGFEPEPHPALWQLNGWLAGFIRNAQMVELGADVCLAFFLPCVKPSCKKPKPHDSHGTAHCAGLAEAAGIPTKRIRPA